MSNTMRIAPPRQGELAQQVGDTPDSLPSLDSLGGPGSLSRPQGKPVLEMPGVDGVKQPISDDPRHPVQSQQVAAYFSRTGNLAGLDTESQAQAIANAMRSLKTEPGKPQNVLILETSGPAAGSYVEELRKSLPLALAMVPEKERPELRFFISDGRPVLPKRDEAASPNEFSNYLIELNKAPNQGRGMVSRDMSIPNTDRGVPNWANPEVVQYFIRERVEPAIALAKEFGVKQIIVDDHIGIPKDNKNANPPVTSMSDFRVANSVGKRPLSPTQAVEVITDAYDQVLDRIKNAGLKTGLSSVTDPEGALAYGIDMNKLARKSDVVEIQAYRSDAQGVKNVTDKLYQSIASHFDQYKDVGEFKFALVTRANKKDLSEATLISQQKAIDDFEQKVERLYRRNNEEPPKVTTSLWAHQNFYK